MTITTTWIVEQMECVPQLDGMDNVVKVVHWRANATDGTHNATSYGSVSLDSPTDPSKFVQYPNLTQNEVLTWVKDSLGSEQVDLINQGLQSSIQNQINPPIVAPPLPW